MANITLGTQKSSVATPTSIYNKMQKHFELPEALLGGTLLMREAGTKYLPREPRETSEAYQIRLAKSVVYDVYGRTLSTYSGVPFARPVTVSDLPTELDYLRTDIDSLGNNLTSFAYEMVYDAIHFGISHAYVEMAFFEEQPSIEQARVQKIRPYLVKISPKDLIGWKTEKINGVDTLSEIRIMESEVIQNDDWSETQVSSVRVIRPTEILIFKADGDGNFNEDPDEVRENTLGFVPLVSAYGRKIGNLAGLPVLEGLSFLALKHYQQQSDLDHVHHISAIPFLFGAGFSESELDGITIGPNRLITSSDKDAKLTYTEYTGAAIASSQKAITLLEERMASLGADLILKKVQQRQTATARKIEQSESMSLLQIIVDNVEVALSTAIDYAADWIDLEHPEADVLIADQLDTPSGPNTEDLLISIVNDGGGLTVEAAAHELVRRGVLSENFKVDPAVANNTPLTMAEPTLDEDNLEDDLNSDNDDGDPSKEDE